MKKQKKKSSYLFTAIIVMQLSLVIFLCIYFLSPVLAPKLKEMSLSADTNQTYDINSKVDITLKTDPEDFEIPDSAFKTSDGKLDFKDNKIIFTSSRGGNFKIYVKYANVKSNTITLYFEDKEAIAQEQAEQERIAQEQAEQARIAQEQAEQAEQARIAQEQAEVNKTTSPGNAANNFNKYNNPTQQQTISNYVLNTNTMKYHKPSCRDVPKIAPENYATFDGTKSDVENQGYQACKHCHP